MVKRIGRFRRKTRSKLRKNIRDRGKIRINDYLREFKEGERVVLKAEPAVQRGIYYPRFHGRSAIVTGKRGRCYEVKVKDINKEKVLVVHPVHLKKV